MPVVNDVHGRAVLEGAQAAQGPSSSGDGFSFAEASSRAQEGLRPVRVPADGARRAAGAIGIREGREEVGRLGAGPDRLLGAGKKQFGFEVESVSMAPSWVSKYSPSFRCQRIGQVLQENHLAPLAPPRADTYVAVRALCRRALSLEGLAVRQALAGEQLRSGDS